MQEKINYLKERIDNISGILGQEEIDPENKIMKQSENENKNISDTINFILNQVTGSSNTSSDILKKCKENK